MNFEKSEFLIIFTCSYRKLLVIDRLFFIRKHFHETPSCSQDTWVPLFHNLIRRPFVYFIHSLFIQKYGLNLCCIPGIVLLGRRDGKAKSTGESRGLGTHQETNMEA